MNKKYTSIETLSEKEKMIIGAALICLSLVTGLLMYIRPEGLKVPVIIAILALSIFFITGVAIVLHGKIAGDRYHQMMRGIILLMSIIPLWIAFDPAEKQCRANLFFLSGELPCRIGFGLGGILLIVTFLITVMPPRKK